jgi:hypothetical protein
MMWSRGGEGAGGGRVFKLNEEIFKYIRDRVNVLTFDAVPKIAPLVMAQEEGRRVR